MRPFTYVSASDPAGAVRACGPDARYLAGGTNLLDLMKEGVERPSSLVDVTRLALTRVGPAEGQPDSGALSIGGLAKNSDTANHPFVRQHLTDGTLSGLLDCYGEVGTRKLILAIGYFALLAMFLNGCRVPIETSDKIGSSTSPLG